MSMLWCLIALGSLLMVAILPVGAAEEVRRFDHDRNGDGRPDQWEHFTAGSKEPSKVERDTDGDGKPDTVWEKGAKAAGSRR